VGFLFTAIFVSFLKSLNMDMFKDGLQVSLWINMQIADDYLLAIRHY
jgi:hypothetical protein